MHRLSAITLLCLALAVLTTPAFAQVFDEKFDHWPVDLKINGRIIVAGSLSDPGIIKDAVRETDLNKKTAILVDESVDEKQQDLLKAIFGDNKSVTMIELDGSKDQLTSALSDSEFVVWHATKPLSNDSKQVAIAARNEFAKFIGDGKILAAIGSPAEIVSQFYVESNQARPPEFNGLNLTPNCVIETNYDNSPAAKNRLLSVLAAHPRCVGIGLQKEAALVLSGRKIRLVGTGMAEFMLMANERQPLRTKTIRTGRARNPEDILVDLTQWRRNAIDRTIERFPKLMPEKPFVENGTLVIVGGGGMPGGLMEQMVEMAGGTENARMVYVPCSESDSVGETQRTVESWKKMGVQHATFIHTKDRNKANTDEEFLAPLKDATCIWFGGGRQWNFADSYYGTKAHKLMKDVLKRGGVIGGSSAGASIQARYLARSTPINNFRIMAFGYERGGLGFISGVAIDQHFSQRRRQNDMTQLVNKYPQLLGIGIDEATAIIVQKSKAKVVGRGKVHFYDRNLPVYPDKPDYIALKKGEAYDLAERKVLEASQETGEEEANVEKPGE